jgi:rare lipoprotein A
MTRPRKGEEDVPRSRCLDRLLAAILAALLAACATTTPARRTPGAPGPETGEASWYGPTFHGKTTANGERYNMLLLTAAHRSLPFGTLVKVTNLSNGRTATVRINDRGPFLKGRILDLSYAAARALGANSPGVIRVRLEVIGKAPGAKPAAGGGAKGRAT